MALLAGFADVDFTPEPGLTLQGQMHERRAERARDPLMANAAAFRAESETAVLVSVDISFLSTEYVAAAQERFAAQTGLPARCLLIHATHTHVAPTVVTLLAARAEPAFSERLSQVIVEAAERALSRLEPVTLFAGTGTMEQMGWNRRAMFADGTSAMYGHANAPGFIGLEGPRDPGLGVLFTRNGQRTITGVLVNFSSHPNSIESASVYSADFPGEARRVLKQALGRETVVVYLTGAAGNTAPSILDPHTPEQPWRGEEGLVRSGLYLGGEALRTIAQSVRPMDAPVLRLKQTTLEIPIRPWPEPGEPAYPLPLVREAWKDARAYYGPAAADWPRRLAKESPVPVRLNVLRVGDAALCTNPAELFVEYGLQLRGLSPAATTLISELTDGCVGYVPTRLAFRRGGYETWAAPSSQLVPEAGEQIVAATRELLEAAFA